MVVNLKSVECFLREVNNDFPIPLSSKVSLSDLAAKYCNQATICCRCKDERIIAMVAGYLDNTIDQLGYISLVAATKDARRKGISSALLGEFLVLAKNKGLKGVHVYTYKTNMKAVGMYRKAGFEEYHPNAEPFPEDHHFIYYLTGPQKE